MCRSPSRTLILLPTDPNGGESVRFRENDFMCYRSRNSIQNHRNVNNKVFASVNTEFWYCCAQNTRKSVLCENIRHHEFSRQTPHIAILSRMSRIKRILHIRISDTDNYSNPQTWGESHVRDFFLNQEGVSKSDYLDTSSSRKI